MVNQRLRFDADEFTATDPLSKSFEVPASAPPLLVRCFNELDAQANAAIFLTDAADDAGDYEVRAGELTMLGGNGTPADGQGEASSEYLTEPWERIRIEVTPAAAPSSGRFDVKTIEGHQ